MTDDELIVRLREMAESFAAVGKQAALHPGRSRHGSRAMSRYGRRSNLLFAAADRLQILAKGAASPQPLPVEGGHDVDIDGECWGAGCPDDDERRLAEAGRIETCSTCGFSGPAVTFIPHDCYWVLRERVKAEGVTQEQDG